MTCTCVMQKKIFGNILESFHAFEHVVQLAKSTRPYPLSVSDKVIVVPYFSKLQSSAACSYNRIVYWRGSPTVRDRKATLVRQHIMELRTHAAFDVATSHRGRCNNKENETCINGMGTGRDGLAKRDMRKMMMKHQFCFIPEGDSPESSRLADAINALCVPVVISTIIAVLRSNVWKGKVVVIEPDAFLRMSAEDVVRLLGAINITCDMRLQLRHETSANAILHRLSELVNYSSHSHVHSVIG